MFGKNSGFDATLDLSSLDGNNGFRLNAGDYFASFSNAGDVNGDGFDDVIVEATGRSYVVFGKNTGFDATLDLSSLDGSNGFRLDGAYLSDKKVSSAGDINGDGFDDVIIGSPHSDPHGNNSGSSYLVFGKVSSFDAAMNLSSLDGNNGFRLDGGAEGDFSGYSVSNAGDVNGDGFDDLLIGALFAGSNGTSYVVFGKASGFDAALDLSSLNGSNGFRLDGAGFDSFGTSVSSAGDVNSDGFDDLFIGAAGGAGYVVFGGSSITGEGVYLGTPGNDRFVGTFVAERFEAGDGNDSMSGLGGADVFHGGAGDDTIAVTDLDFQLVDGGTGNDTLALWRGDINLNLADFHDTISGIETIHLGGTITLTITLADLLSLSETTNTFTVHGNVDNRVIGLNSNGWADGGIEGDYHI